MSDVFKDSAEIRTTTGDLNALPKHEHIPSQVRPISGSNGLFWSFIVYGSQRDMDSEFFYVDITVTKKTMVDVTLFVGPLEPMEHHFSQLIVDGTIPLPARFFTKKLGDNGVIRCEITITTFTKATHFHLEVPTMLDLVKYADHCEKDVEILVGKTLVLKVHRYFLSLISPVFQTYFAHKTKEASTGQINITDFDVDTVKNVFSYCYGTDIGRKNVPEIVNMLRFADKYDIKIITHNLEDCLYEDINSKNFATITQYAYDLDRSYMQHKCAMFYRHNHASLTLTAEFGSLSALIKDKLICRAIHIQSVDILTGMDLDSFW
uniref:BTB domain-containing protein n=1 Tax=Panagrellus redivivus TaxID=6233 RepID=A0A7E4V6T4_PANRE